MRVQWTTVMREIGKDESEASCEPASYDLGWGLWWSTMTRERGRDVMRVRERQRAQRVIESEASCKGFYFDPLRIQFQMTPYREKNNKIIIIIKKDNALDTKWCHLRLKIRDTCELPEPLMVHRIRQSDRSSYGSLLFLHGTVLDVKQTVKMNGSRFS